MYNNNERMLRRSRLDAFRFFFKQRKKNTVLALVHYYCNNETSTEQYYRKESLSPQCLKPRKVDLRTTYI